MSGIVDGRRWVDQRVRHLEDLLHVDHPGELSDAQRQAVEAELEQLRRPRRRSLLRWLRLPGTTDL